MLTQRVGEFKANGRQLPLYYPSSNIGTTHRLTVSRNTQCTNEYWSLTTLTK